MNQTLLEMLADGRWHSGEELAQRLGVSRTAVWKQLHKLEEDGISVERQRSQGYRIVGGLDLLDRSSVLACLPAQIASSVSLSVLPSVGSTNTYLSQHPRQSEYDACLAERQTAGRGRRGRHWVSPFAQNLYLSVAFDLAGGMSSLDGLSLVIGVAVVEALASIGVQRLALKWPNDIWLGGRKLGGVLIELQGELQTTCQVIVGVGLNVYMMPDSELAIDQPWTSLRSGGAAWDGGRNRIAGALLNALIGCVESFRRDGFEPWRERWERRDALKDKPVVTLPGELRGVGQGIDATGAYGIETRDGVVWVHSGEISLRMDA